MDECRLLVMLHRALPTRGHGCVEKQSLSVHPSVSLDASPLLWRIGAPRALLGHHTHQCNRSEALGTRARAMRLRLLLTGCCLHAVTARRPPADAVAQKHINEGALNAYAIGEGFEGSASDWTEYVVWSVGVAALIFYLSGTVKINVYNIDEEPAAAQEPGAIAVRVLESLDDMALVASLKEVITKTVRESNEKNELSRRYAPAELDTILGRFCDLEAHLATRLIYIASIDDDVAGCGMLTRATGEVRQMVCLPAYQGRGVGSAILREIIDEARDRDLGRLHLECPPVKRDWYARFGFVDCARRPSDTAAEFPGVNARAPMELVL